MFIIVEFVVYAVVQLYCITDVFQFCSFSDFGRFDYRWSNVFRTKMAQPFMYLFDFI